jgi:hypothetical protein
MVTDAIDLAMIAPATSLVAALILRHVREWVPAS